jgi:hypothetical protein
MENKSEEVRNEQFVVMSNFLISFCLMKRQRRLEACKIEISVYEKAGNIPPPFPP